MLQQVKNRHRGRKDHDIHKVQLQLITSCGMNIQPKNILTRDKNSDTLVFLCDGISTEAQREQTKEVLITRSQAIIWNDSKMSEFDSSEKIKSKRSQINLEEKSQIEVDTIKDWKSKDVTKGGNGVFYPAGAKDDASWDPFIRIYKPVKIPLLA